jgi:hypothetical protein
MAGQLVCDMHGGKSPQALIKAEDRMRDLVDPAISSLKRQIDADEFPAAKYVLDWAGFKPAAVELGDGDVTVPVRVTLAFDRTDEPTLNPFTLELPPHAENGHTPAT